MDPPAVSLGLTLGIKYYIKYMNIEVKIILKNILLNSNVMVVIQCIYIEAHPHVFNFGKILTLWGLCWGHNMASIFVVGLKRVKIL